MDISYEIYVSEMPTLRSSKDAPESVVSGVLMSA
jgi:hypothetical protein